MSAVLALTRAQWLRLVSYRMQLALSLLGLLGTVVPLYFIAGAVQPIMAKAIRGEGGQAFGFLLVGMMTLSLVNAAIQALPQQVSRGISTGTLEALLATPVPLPGLLGGLCGFQVLWSGLRGALILAVGAALGANVLLGHVPAALLVLALIVVAHLPFGILAAAAVLAFRTAGPLPRGVLLASGLLGGVYYPTHVIPSWLESLSSLLPLSYGLHALRRVLLDGASLGAVSGDLGPLVAGALVLLALSSVAFWAALRYARRQGTLAQY